MIYRGEIYYGPEHKSIFMIYGSAESVSEALYQADTYIRMTRKYKYVSCSHHPLWQYWILTIYYAVLEWVLRKQGKWHDSAEGNND
jgi:hypothetical protein